MNSEFKGTPAPWTLPHFADSDSKCNCGFVLADGHCGAIATVHYSKDNSIANGDSPLPEQAIANAHLIAAAPELLEALQIMVAGYNINRITHEDFLKAESAINKALGLAISYKEAGV